MICENYLFIDGHFQELFYSSTSGCGIFFSSTDSLPRFFYSLTSLHLTKSWCVELDFLRQLVIFIHEVCDKMSNRNISDPNKENWRLLARLWDAAKWRGDGKCYCLCTQCRGFKRRGILIATTTKNCREHGHAKGGNKYCPFVGLALESFLYSLFW